MAQKPLRKTHLKEVRPAFTHSMLHQAPLAGKSRFDSAIMLSSLSADVNAYFAKRWTSKNVITGFSKNAMQDIQPVFGNIEMATDFFTSRKYLIDAKTSGHPAKQRKKMDAMALKTQAGSILSAIQMAHELFTLKPCLVHEELPLSETSLNQLKAFFEQIYAMRESLLATENAISSTLKNFQQDSQTTYSRAELAKLADALKRLHAIQSSLADYSPAFDIVYELPATLIHEAKEVIPTLKERKAAGKDRQRLIREIKKASRRVAKPILSGQIAEASPPVPPTEAQATASQEADSPEESAKGQTGIAASVKNMFKSFLSHLPGSGSKKPPQGSA